MTKDEYKQAIISLNSQFCKKPGDYTKENVIVHNAAAKKLNLIEKALTKDIEMAMLVYGELMESEDNFTRTNAAAWSLELKVNTKKAVRVLRYQKNMEMSGSPWEPKDS